MMFHHASISIVMFHHASISIVMFHHASISIVMFHHASISIVMFHHASISIVMFHHASISIVMFHHVYSSIVMFHHHMPYRGIPWAWCDIRIVAGDGVGADLEAVLVDVPWVPGVVDAVVEAVVVLGGPGAHQVVGDRTNRLLIAAFRLGLWDLHWPLSFRW